MRQDIREIGKSAFLRWFNELDGQVAAMIAIHRLAEGDPSNVKALRKGMAELKINRGPGNRVYLVGTARYW
jgi:putative addiction module killer protein